MRTLDEKILIYSNALSSDRNEIQDAKEYIESALKLLGNLS